MVRMGLCERMIDRIVLWDMDANEDNQWDGEYGEGCSKGRLL